MAASPSVPRHHRLSTPQSSAFRETRIRTEAKLPAMPPSSARYGDLQHPEDLWNHLKRRSITRRQLSLAERTQETEYELASAKERLHKLQLLNNLTGAGNPISNQRQQHSQCQSQGRSQGLEQTPARGGSGGKFTSRLQSTAEQEEEQEEEEEEKEKREEEERTGHQMAQMVDQVTSVDDAARFIPGLGIDFLPQHTLPTHTTVPPSAPVRGITKPNTHFLIPLTRPRSSNVTIPGLPALSTPHNPHPTQLEMPPHSPSGPFMALHPLWGPLMTDHPAFTHVQRPLGSLPWIEGSSVQDGKEDQERASLSPRTPIHGTHARAGPLLIPRARAGVLVTPYPQSQANVASPETPSLIADSISTISWEENFRTLAILNSEGVYRRRCAEAGFGGMDGVKGLCRMQRDEEQAALFGGTIGGGSKEGDVEDAVGWLRDKGCFEGEMGKGWVGEGVWNGRLGYGGGNEED